MKKTKVAEEANLFKEAADKLIIKTKMEDQPFKLELDKSYQKQLKRLKDLKNRMDTLKKETDKIKEELYSKGAVSFLDQYDKFGKRPSNFYIVAGDESMLFIVQDKYKEPISKKNITILKEKYKSGVLAEGTIYMLNPEIVLNNVGALNEAIKSSKMSEEAKNGLLVAKPACKVKAGTIDKLKEFEKEDAIETGYDFRELFMIIQPTKALRMPGEVGEE